MPLVLHPKVVVVNEVAVHWIVVATCFPSCCEWNIMAVLLGD